MVTMVCKKDISPLRKCPKCSGISNGLVKIGVEDHVYCAVCKHVYDTL